MFLLGTVMLIIKTRRRPILFVRQGALGDIICSIPAAFLLMKRHSGAPCIYSCLPDFACIPAILGLTEHVTHQVFTAQSRWRFLFGAIYNFEYGGERAETTSAGTIIADFCRQYQVPETNVHPSMKLDRELLNHVRGLLVARGVVGQYCAVHIGPSWPVREWPRKKWS
jgi:hypothetical protein